MALPADRESLRELALREPLGPLDVPIDLAVRGGASLELVMMPDYDAEVLSFRLPRRANIRRLPNVIVGIASITCERTRDTQSAVSR